MSDRTLKITAPHMTGTDVAGFQRDLLRRLDNWGATAYPLKVDGDYGVGTRAAAATVCHGLGIAQTALKNGVSPRLRSRIRNATLTAPERERYKHREGWRRDLADKWSGGGVAPPVNKIITHANGWTGPRGHDGVDLICPEDAALYSMCRSKIVRADASGWWANNAQPSPGHPVSDGDGIVILQSLVDVGPIKRGMCFGYGHAEHANVTVGQIVAAGQRVALAGFARAPHIHLMVNSGAAKFWRGSFARGVGDRDPWPIVAYCIAHA